MLVANSECKRYYIVASDEITQLKKPIFWKVPHEPGRQYDTGPHYFNIYL